MKRGAPMKRTEFARKSTAENIPSKVAESYSDKAQEAIKCIVKMQPKTPPVTPAFQGVM